MELALVIVWPLDKFKEIFLGRSLVSNKYCKNNKKNKDRSLRWAYFQQHREENTTDDSHVRRFLH